MNKRISLTILLLILILLTLLVINLSSCDTTEPIDEIEPGRRDYTWTVDTLKMPFFSSLHRIWGSSENDVWAIGPGGDLSKTIYHYDGEKWSNDGISRPVSPISIWGFAQNDVWIGSLEGIIFHYDGKEWKESLRLPHPQFLWSGFKDIYGDKYNDVYAVGFVDSTDGRKGMIFHYDGQKWERKIVNHKHGTLLRIKRGKKTSDKYFIWGLWEDNFIGDSSKIFIYDGKNTLNEIAKSRYFYGKWHSIQEINNEVIFTIDNSLYTYNKSYFELFTSNPFPDYYQGIFGRNRKDIFWLMDNGITHFNGSNFEYVLEVSNTQRLVDAVLFKDVIFFLAIDLSNGLNLVYKGTLKE